MFPIILVATDIPHPAIEAGKVVEGFAIVAAAPVLVATNPKSWMRSKPAKTFVKTSNTHRMSTLTARSSKLLNQT